MTRSRYFLLSEPSVAVGAASAPRLLKRVPSINPARQCNDSVFVINTCFSSSTLQFNKQNNILDKTIPSTLTMNPTKMTAQEKEAQIMAEIRSNTVKFTPKYETTFFGNFFGFGFKSN
ncbi:hypothetical protein OXX79_009318 [Metschnikowia pulcherrima]